MKYFLAAALATALPTCALAQDNLNLPAPYMELAIGASFTPTVSTKTYTLTISPDTATGRVDLNYKSSLTGGAEIGVAGLFAPQLRFGFAYDFLRAEFDDGNVVGTVNGTPGTYHFTRAGIASIGGNLDNDVHLLTGNIYYSLPMMGMVRPYVGMGVGAAMVQNADTQLAFTATAGVRAAWGDKAYYGLRYRYYNINGPTDALGIQYEDIGNHSIMALIGFYLD